MNNNIILIGFMGTGKSTISKELHEKTGRKEIDLDAYITEKSGMTINDIFAKSGETAFRDLESACLAEVLKNDQQIVSLWRRNGAAHRKCCRDEETWPHYPAYRNRTNYL